MGGGRQIGPHETEELHYPKAERGSSEATMTAANSIEWREIRPREPALADHPDVIMRSALDRRADELWAFLDDAARQGRPILLLINDSHRATRTRTALQALATLCAGREPPFRFRALIAAGTHRFSDAERAGFERETLASCGLAIESVAWHDAADATASVRIGEFRFHREVAAARLLLPIGSAEPHYFAGVTGAHKTCTIGVMSREDIERNHRGALDPASDVMALAGNPVHDGIVRAAAALDAAGKLIFAINQVVCGGALLGAAAGDVFGSLDELLPLVRATYIQTVDEPADVLHLRVPPPLGRSFYQADKALKNNHLAVRDGGAIVLDAECPEGVGPDAFMNLLRQAPDYDGAVRAVEARGYQLGDHKGVKLRYLTDAARRGVRVAIISRNISAADAHALGMRVFANADDALAWLKTAASGGLRRGLVIDDAGFVSVRAESAQR